MGKNKTGKRGLKIAKISSSHKGICVHTPSGKKIFIDISIHTPTRGATLRA